MLTKLKKLLERHEGKDKFPYMDTKGKITIGIGRNLTDKGISDEIMRLLFNEDLDEAASNLYKYLPWTRDLDEVRLAALIDMCFNMGIGNSHKGLRSFTSTLPLIRDGEYERAATNLRKSKWYKDVKEGRAETIISMIVTGKWPSWITHS